MNISSFATNEKLELTGIWRSIGDNAKVLVARNNNTNYLNMLRVEMSPYKTLMQRKNLGEVEAAKMHNRIMARTILLGWENIDGDDSVSIPYSEENAIMLLEKYKEFKNMILNLSDDIESFSVISTKEVLDEVKN